MKSMINAWTARNKFNQREDLSSQYPVRLNIESTNYCNIKCVMCPHNGLMTRKKGFMKFSLFKKVVDESKGYVRDSWLHIVGEPLLHPRIFDMIKYSVEAGIDTGMSTNALLLSKEISKKIFDSGLDRLILSLDGATKETYEKLRQLSNYEKAVSNIEEFLESKKELGVKKPYVILQIISMSETKKEIESFCNKWKGLPVDEIAIKELDTWAGQMESLKKEKDGEIEKLPSRYPCRLLWLILTVHWNGDVVPCCRDFNASYAIGNLCNQSLGEIWNGERMRELRRKDIKLAYSSVPLCRRCVEWSLFPPKISKRGFFKEVVVRNSLKKVGLFYPVKRLLAKLRDKKSFTNTLLDRKDIV